MRNTRIEKEVLEVLKSRWKKGRSKWNILRDMGSKEYHLYANHFKGLFEEMEDKGKIRSVAEFAGKNKIVRYVK